MCSGVFRLLSLDVPHIAVRASISEMSRELQERFSGRPMTAALDHIADAYRAMHDADCHQIVADYIPSLLTELGKCLAQ